MFNKLLTATLGLAILTGMACSSVQADPENITGFGVGRLSMAGTATVQGEPDVAYISAAVVTKNNNAQVSLDANARFMGKVYEVLEGEGIARKDIATSNFSFDKTYRNVKDGDNYKQVFDGYRTSNNIRVTVKELSILGRIITSLVDAGVTNMGGVSFGSTEKVDNLDKARALSMKDAIRKAKILAEAGGFKLVRIISVEEHQQQVHRPQPRYARMAASMADDTPISGGSLDFSVNISVVWEIAPE